MRQRLAAAAPALPEPVVAKMLDMEAGELDLILQYPVAAAAQVRIVCLCWAGRKLACEVSWWFGPHATVP